MGHFGNLIQSWLDENGRTVGWLATRSGGSRSTMYKAMKHGGAVEDATLRHFESATGIPFDRLRREVARDTGVRLEESVSDEDVRAVIDLMSELPKKERRIIRAGVQAQVAARRGRSEGQAGKRATDTLGEESQDPGDVDPA